MLARQRHLFVVDDDVAYFNAARMGPRLKAAAQAGAEALALTSLPWAVETQKHFFDVPEIFRARMGDILGADADGIAIAPSVSYGLGVAALNLPVEAGQEIIVLDGQFPSNVYVWRALAERTGAHVRTVARPPGAGWTDALLDAVTDAAAIVACPQVHWLDGGVIDLERVSVKVRAHGGALALDLTQSVGAMPFNAQAVQPDFAVAALYKWGLGPYVTAALYAAPHRRAGVPLEQTWITRAGANDFARLTDYRDDVEPGARRYDMGERAQFLALPMAIAALDQLLAWGAANVSEALGALNHTVSARLAEIGLEAEPPHIRAPHYLGVALPARAPDDIVAQLEARGVHVSQRGDRLRVTGHLHINDADIDRLVAALAELIA